MKIKSKVINDKIISSKIINANAGSGKTYNIIERIAQIIEEGHAPSSILCITFTKAGVGEMQERLEAKCHHLFEKEHSSSERPKIVTFHALCQEIVSMFSHELQMPYQFENMEYIEESFIETITSKVLTLPQIKEIILKFNLSYNEVTALCKSFIEDCYNILPDAQVRERSLCELFKITQPVETERQEIYRLVLSSPPISILSSLKGKTAKEGLPEILNLLQETQSDAGSGFTKEIFEKYTALISSVRGNEIKEYKANLNEKIERLKTINQYEISLMLNNCFNAIAQIIEKTKKLEGKYLFEDIVQKALSILKNPELKDFALFKIGSNYKHFLIDEAQDTNQDQWKLIDCLMEENLASNMQEGSLFIVGDIKQTIYGFQGAESEMMRDVYLKYQQHLQEEFLTKSYRTTKPVLDVINKAFDVDEKQIHISDFNDVGTVLIARPILEEGEKQAESKAECEKIANFVAQCVKNLLGTNLLHNKHQGTKIEPKHIVILSRSRHDQTTTALHDAFHQNNIPISFNTKVNYKNYNAVLNLIALLKLCTMEGDTQNAYSILSSNIFEISPSVLSPHFNKQTTIESIFAAFPQLKMLIDFLRPILLSQGITAFFYTIYTQFKKKHTKQEQQVIVQFIEHSSKARQFEVLKFIQAFEKSKQSFINKPQAENAVTFTTAHSSKGLQYPIVFFLETQGAHKSKNDSKILVHHSAAIYNFTKENRSPLVQSIIDKNLAFSQEEEFRIQYVVISRAEEKFYYIGNNYNTCKTNDGQPTNPHAMFHKLEKAITPEFVRSTEEGFEVYQLNRT